MPHRPRVPLHGWVPYDRAAHWRLADAYFAQRGLAAWSEGEVPSKSTSNEIVARHHAGFLLAAAPEGPVTVLEVGSGSGEFTWRLLAALDHDLGAPGRALAARLTYVMSDYSERSLREAAASPALRPLVASGRVIPAVYDLRGPARIRPLDGAPRVGPYHAVFANYVACATPFQVLSRDASGWSELHVRVLAEVPAPCGPEAAFTALLADATREGLAAGLEFERRWEPVTLDPSRSGVLERRVAGLERALVAYPHAFFECLRRLAPELAPSGVIVVTDGPGAPADDVETPRDPHFYGNAAAHGLDFALFDAFAADIGCETLRTLDASRPVSVAVLCPDRAALSAAFGEAYVDAHDADDLLDFTAAARRFAKDDPRRAARFLARCVALVPRDAEMRLRLVRACIDGGVAHEALAHAEVGEALPGGEALDFAFQRGRAYASLGRTSDAITWYSASLAREERPRTLTNLGESFRLQGDFDAAWRCFRRALELRPGLEAAVEGLRALRGA